MPSYTSGFTVSSHALTTLADVLRQRRGRAGTRWRRLTVGRQALLVMAHLRQGRDLRRSRRRVRESLEILAALEPSLPDAIAKAFVLISFELAIFDLANVMISAVLSS